MRKTMLVAVAALFSTAAYAQAPATPNLVELGDDQTGVTVLGLTVDQIEDLDLFDAQGTKLGEVEEVLGTDAATATALAIDLEGSNDKDVILEISNVELQDNRLVTTLTMEDLNAMPGWND